MLGVPRAHKARYTLATKKSTATRCRIHVVAHSTQSTLLKLYCCRNRDWAGPQPPVRPGPSSLYQLLPKPATKLNVYGSTRLCCRFRQQSTFNNFVANVYMALRTKGQKVKGQGDYSAHKSSIISR